MHLHVDDDGFVRAPAPRCYRMLTDVERWPSFWPRTQILAAGDDRFELVIGRVGRRIRVTAELGGWRHEAGFTVLLTGDLEGRWEVWLERGWNGTVVHHVVAATGGARAGRRFRRWLRGGLWGVKDALESEVLVAAAAAPGRGRVAS